LRFVLKITTVGAVLHIFKFVGDVEQIGPANSLSMLKTLVPKGVSIASFRAVKLTSSSAKYGGKAAPVVKNVIVEEGRGAVSLQHCLSGSGEISHWRKIEKL
jgi:hypothetical protein